MAAENKNTTAITKETSLRSTKQSAHQEEIATAKKPRNDVRVPKLRFKEFDGDWEKKRLGNIAKVSSGGTPSRINIKFWNGNIPWITTSLINFNIISDSVEKITEEALINSSAKLFPIGTILMAMYGQGKTRGKVARLGIEATTNQACAAIIVSKKIDGNYLYQNLAGRYDEIRKLSNDGGQQNLSGGIIKLIKISIPNIQEQQKIATFLTSVDDKIEQLTQKKTLLEQYKKGVMQQVFSKQLRFKTDDGSDFTNWEEKKLGEVCDSIKSGKSKSNETGVFPLYGSTGIIGKCDDFSHDGFFILIARVGANSGTINVVNDKFGVSDNTLVVVCNNAIDIKFIYFYLDFYNLNRLVFGSGQPLITGGQLKSLKLNIPSLKEQQKIATYLSAIDIKIENVQTQIAKTQTFKKGLLQQMFV
ncbi:restriction endonuclease subunit S [Polaribacter sp. 11A2H]|uniref:restriction endonuclease subunit S n=1 Tax=Polaribacter sp. 11A2H TaxID=2687290 RepID=UPI0014073D6F|nr:restriction endonuclease subunit S [Polaribacter sp. 11A2H]